MPAPVPEHVLRSFPKDLETVEYNPAPDACAKSGIDLFFCSPEHQKLVWKHHKQVCGPNAQPLRYPMLSDDEIADLLAHADDFVQAFKSPPDFLSAQQQQAAVQLLRGSLKTAKETLNGGFEVPFTQLTFWTHVDRFNDIALQHWIRMSGIKVAFDPKTPEWWSCCHHAIAFLSLVWQRAEKGVNAVPVELIHRSCEAYLDSIAALSPFVDEEEISKVIGDFLAELRVVLLIQFITVVVGAKHFIRCQG